MVGSASAPLEELLLALGAGVEGGERTLSEAQSRAAAAARASGGDRAAAFALVGATLAGYALAAPLAAPAVAEVTSAVGDVTGESERAARVELFLRAIAEVAQADVAPRVALEAVLRLLGAIAPATGVSLWTEHVRDAAPIAAVGDIPSPRVRGAGEVVVVSLDDGGPVLVAVPERGADRAVCAAYLELAAPGVLEHVERAARLEDDAAGEASLAEASERRLIRLGYDLHDGALQNVAALTADLRLFRVQLEAVLPADPAPAVLGRIDDLEARLVELERELRELAQSLQPQSLLSRPLAEAVQAELDGFRSRHSIDTTLRLDGAFADATASQRLALLRVLQEALANAREHGGATRVDVSLAESPDGLALEIVDNGSGFTVDAAVERAARRGRLGLAGMRERVALLGGSFEIRSRPGGPTAVSARLRRWTPIAE